MKKKFDTNLVVQASVIAAVYVVSTFAFMPFSYGLMQVRVSEALTVLPAFTPAAVWGLFVGCLVANGLGPNGAVDMVVGSLATLIAAVASHKLKHHPVLVPLPPVIVNAVLVGWELSYVYGLGTLLACMAWVGLGELISCYLIGLPLMKLLRKYEGTIFKNGDL